MRDRHTIALAAVIVLGGALRFATVGEQSYWYDEAVTVGLVRMDLPGMLSAIPHSESTPPLYYVLAWGWSKIFGTGEAGLRSLSALFGTAALPAFYAAARQFFDRRVGLAVAALAAVNPLLIWYSQEARSYALVMFLGALSVLFLGRALERPQGRTLALWALTAALAVTAHYFAAFLVVAEVAVLLRAWRTRGTLIAVGAVAATAMALLPLAIHQQSLDLASFIRTAPLPYRLARAPKQYLVGFESPLEVPVSILAGIIALAGLVFAAVRVRRRSALRLATVLALSCTALPFVLALAGSDYFDTRNLILAWLPLAALVAAGLLAAPRPWGLAAIGVLGALGLASAIGVDVEPTWQRDNWRGAAHALGPATTPRAVVITPASGATPFAHYAPGTRPLRGEVSLHEVALVSKNQRTLTSIHPPPPPRPAHPVVPNFTEVRRVYAPTYTVIVFRAGPSVGVTAPVLQNDRLLKRNTEAAVLLQMPLTHAGSARRPAGG